MTSLFHFRSSMIRPSLWTRPEKFRLTTSFKRYVAAAATSNSEEVLIQTLLNQSTNNTKPLPCESTSVVRSAVLKLLARKEYVTVTRAIEMVFEIRNGTSFPATAGSQTLFRPALHCRDSMHAGVIAYGKLRKPNKSRQLVQRLQKEGLWPIMTSSPPTSGTGTGTGAGNASDANNSTDTTSQSSLSSLSSTQSTISFLMQAYCDADRLDLAEDLFLQWLLLSGKSSNSSGSTTLTTIATLGNAASSEEVALDAIVEYLTSYRKIMTSTTTSGLNLNPASSSTDNREGVVNINNNDSSSSLSSGSIDLSSLLLLSSGDGSSSSSLTAIPPPMWLSLLRLYADRGEHPYTNPCTYQRRDTL